MATVFKPNPAGPRGVQRWRGVLGGGLAVLLAVSGAVHAQSARPGMGAIPYSGGVTFRVWAPNASSVAVRGDFNAWGETALVSEGNGNWSVDVAGAVAGQKYKYYLNGSFWKRDPRARQVVNSTDNSIIYDRNSFDWGATPIPQPARKDLVIYEMHVGTYEGGTTPRTFDHAIARLDHLQDLGINAIKLMPINEFPGGRSWGYNPADPYAVESDYGGPDAFKRFVKACHERGLAVILDVVHNHYGPTDMDLWQFDGWSSNSLGGIYFYNDGRAPTSWGNTRPNFGSAQVGQFIRDQIFMWVEEYRVGGFRWDSVYNILNTDLGANSEGRDLLNAINSELASTYPHVVRCAEDHAFDFAIYFENQWDVNYWWALRDQVVAASDAERNMYNVRDLLDDWPSHNRVVFSEAHDYVGSLNGRTRLPAQIDSTDPESLWARRRALLAAGIVMTTPGIPMIFQGQEMHETLAFHDDTALRWARTNSHAGIVQAYTDLIHCRRNLAGGLQGLKGTGINVNLVNNTDKVVSYIRWDAGGQADDVVVVANFSSQTRNNYSIPFPSTGTWHSRFNSDSTEYQPDFTGIGPAQVQVSGSTAPVSLGAYSLQIFSKEREPVPATAAFDPSAPVGCGAEVTITYSPHDGDLAGVSPVYAYIGLNNWASATLVQMTASGDDWTAAYEIPADTYELNVAFTDANEEIWDDNDGDNWTVTVQNCGTPPLAPETVYWRGDAGLNNNWANTDASGINNWWRAGDQYTVRRPDLSNNVWSATGQKNFNIAILDNAARPAMALNDATGTGGTEFQLHQILFQNGTSRTLTQGGNAYLHLGGGSGNAKIEATSPNGSGTYTFNVPVQMAKTTELNPVGGDLIFNGAITNGGYGLDVWGGAGKSLTLAGVVSGSGGLNLKSSLSQVGITGHSTYNGDTAVGTGMLVVNGSISNSAVSVGSGGVVSGAGTIGALTLAGGTVRPGNSVGTLTVNGNADLGGGTYECEIASTSPTDCDLIAAKGSLMASSTLTINLPETAPEGFDPDVAYYWVVATGQSVSADNMEIGTKWSYPAGLGGFGLEQWGQDIVVTYTTPTSVTFFQFGVRAENGQVVIRWRASAHGDTVGFWVERLDGDEWVPVNSQIIYAHDVEEMDDSYAQVDTNAVVGGTYSYRIIEETSAGDDVIHGPFERTASALAFVPGRGLDVEPGGIRIRWQSREDETYRVRRSTNLLEGLDGFLPIAAGLYADEPENEYLDTNAAPLGIYLIEVEEE